MYMKAEPLQIRTAKSVFTLNGKVETSSSYIELFTQIQLLNTDFMGKAISLISSAIRLHIGYLMCDSHLIQCQERTFDPRFKLYN